ncbi:unnamed protein product [Chrysodeixis includens]|uniref:Uncharacterized protein n=1 Tax=Chrysodeixis includens TaxID=689277 RepID=A0A9N8PWF2_CHRIL|nr:unnamed protein product [Chrysodeixis includens]
MSELKPDGKVLSYVKKKKEKESEEGVSPGEPRELGDSKVKPTKIFTRKDSALYPLLLKHYDKLNVYTDHYASMPFGQPPLSRPIDEYVRSGFINLDKPSNSTSHEVVSCIKSILKVKHVGHSGTLDPNMSGCLIVCLGRAKILVRSQQNASKEYIAVFSLYPAVEDIKKITEALAKLTGVLYQGAPLYPAVQPELRLRQVYGAKLLEFDREKNMGMFQVSCEAGTYISTLCKHLGLMLGVGAQMVEVRRIRSGIYGEKDNMVIMQDIFDAQRSYEDTKDESYLRQIIKPLEALLVYHKRIFIKDYVVNATCYGSPLLLSGIIRYEDGIEENQEIVLVTTKGEAVAIAIALMSTSMIASWDYGTAAIPKRVIMKRDTYPRSWEFAQKAMQRKLQRIANKFHKSNKFTPSDRLNSNVDNKMNRAEGAGVKKRTASTANADDDDDDLDHSVHRKSEKKIKTDIKTPCAAAEYCSGNATVKTKIKEEPESDNEINEKIEDIEEEKVEQKLEDNVEENVEEKVKEKVEVKVEKKVHE